MYLILFNSSFPAYDFKMKKEFNQRQIRKQTISIRRFGNINIMNKILHFFFFLKIYVMLNFHANHRLAKNVSKYRINYVTTTLNNTDSYQIGLVCHVVNFRHVRGDRTQLCHHHHQWTTFAVVASLLEHMRQIN